MNHESRPSRAGGPLLLTLAGPVQRLHGPVVPDADDEGAPRWAQTWTLGATCSDRVVERRLQLLAASSGAQERVGTGVRVPPVVARGKYAVLERMLRCVSAALVTISGGALLCGGCLS